MSRPIPIAILAAALAAPGAAAAAPVTALPPAKPPAISEVAPGVSSSADRRPTARWFTCAQAPRRASRWPRCWRAAGHPARLAHRAVGARLDAGALAGINGDFFNTSTNDPSGVLLIAGELIHEPEPSRSSLVFLPGGGLDAVTLALQGRIQALDPTGAVTYPQRTINGLNRPAKRGSETILYTPGYGSLATPVAGSRYEVRIRLDQPGPLSPNQPRTGTVVAAGSGGGMTIGAGNVVVTGVGSAGTALVSDFPLGRVVGITPGLLSLPAGAVDAIGGGPCSCAAAWPSPARARASRAPRWARTPRARRSGGRPTAPRCW